MSDPCITQIPTSKLTSIGKLDDEIQSLTTRLCVLKSERNSLTITYTIPAEILAEIFIVVRRGSGHQDNSDSGSEYSSRSSSDRGGLGKSIWPSMTYVSQHWRRVALECPQLWCDIRVGTLTALAIQTLLERSGGTSLSVTIPSSYGRARHGVELANVFAETSRIETLEFSLDNKSLVKLLPRLISAPAPKLRSLSIAEGGDVPDNLFAATPQLRSLSLSNCKFNLDSSIFMTDLTILDVFRCPVGSPTGWLNVLRRMPRLSHLSMKSSFTGETYIPIPTHFDLVPLLQLSQVAIEGSSFQSDLDFLSHITFTSQTSIKFTSSANGAEHPVSPLVAFLQSHRKSCYDRDISPAKTQITTVKLAWDDHFPIIRFDVHANGRRKHYLAVTIVIVGSHPPDWNQTPMADIVLLPISLATSFTTNCKVKEEDWKVLSDGAPRLQEISVSKLAAQSFLLALGAGDIDSLDPNGEWRGAAGYLGGMEAERGVGLLGGDEETIVVAESGVESHQPFKFLNSINLYDHSLLGIREDVMNALSARCITGLPIEAVRFSRHAVVHDDFFFELKGLVHEVEYDERGWVRRHRRCGVQ
ncbi:hypothetical protein BDN72DRAFT_843817 [Pluteus cervinus]|uniref:Uncharacterized protein n=1 Tax=Pluteus cervinus TaxID=181527 RepID=A0ACD3ALU5_9AGAR|nr:hypothetical protein BDN72DRAFT_843817 [Pluteus cervinus]